MKQIHEDLQLSEKATPAWTQLIASIPPSLRAYVAMERRQLEALLKLTPLSFWEHTFEKKGKFFSGEVKSQKDGLYSEVLEEILSPGDEASVISPIEEAGIGEDMNYEYKDKDKAEEEDSSWLALKADGIQTGSVQGELARSLVRSLRKANFLNSRIGFELLKKAEVTAEAEIHIKTKSREHYMAKINALVQDVLMESETKKKKKIEIPLKVFWSGNFPPKETVVGNENRGDLTENQNEAFQRAKNPEKTPVLFLHGGPGTGKTKVEVDMTKEHIEQGRTVLLLSHSNKGAQVPAQAFAEILGKKSKKYIHVAGNRVEKTDPSLYKYRTMAGAPAFPTEKLQAVNELSDKEILKLLQKKGESLNETSVIEKVVEERENQRKLIEEKYEEKAKAHKKKIEKKLKQPGLTVSTFGSLLNDDILRDMKFDIVIVDEATRMRSPELLQALQKAKQQIIFVGDPVQLGNIPLKRTEQRSFKRIISEENTEKYTHGQNDFIDEEDLLRRFENGPFVDAIQSCKNPEKELPYVFLDKNFRSLPNIVKVLSELMYDGKLKPGREKEEHDGIVKWYDTQFADAKERSAGTSKRNTGEAKFIGEKVLGLLLRKENPVTPEDIAIIATYNEQAKLIQKYLKRKLFYSPGKTKNKDIYERLKKNIATVDAFQGEERKVVFVSMTRSNDEGEIGFLDEERRMGVAIGRAADELYLVGNAKTVAGGNGDGESREFFEKLHSLVEEHGEIETIRPKKKKNSSIDKVAG